MKKKNKTILIILILSTTTISFLSLNITNAAGATFFTPTPDPPNDSVYWDFDVGDKLGWRIEVYNGSDFWMALDIIYNVSAFPYFKNYSGNGINYYGVQVRGMIFNTSTNSLEEIPLSSQNPYLNYSLVNFTYSDFVEFGFGGSLYSLPVNPFIPINGTLMMQWCADRLKDEYMMYLGFDFNPTISYPDANTMRFENSTGSGEYVETSYYNNGTLKSALIFSYLYGSMFPEGILYNFTRILDFNFILSTNAGTPDTDGNFTLTWTMAINAKNYSIYQYSEPITSINGSLTLVVDESTNLNTDLAGYTNGTYYFIAVAHNNDGDTLSNWIRIDVAIPPEPGSTDGEAIAGYNLYFLLILFSVSIGFIIRKRRRYK